MEVVVIEHKEMRSEGRLVEGVPRGKDSLIIILKYFAEHDYGKAWHGYSMVVARKEV